MGTHLEEDLASAVLFAFLRQYRRHASCEDIRLMIAPGPHWLILTSIAVLSIIISFILRRHPKWQAVVRGVLATLLTANELTWYGYRLAQEGFRFPEALPMQLCDLTLWLTVLAVVTLKPGIYELAYFGGVGGSSMALLTPDLWERFPSYPTIYFFLSHGLVVATLLGLTISGAARPRKGSVWRAYLGFNLFAVFVACFNAVFETNYMYLCTKPASGSLLDYFGPWPIYVLVGDLFALAVFGALALPFRKARPMGMR